MEPAGVDPCIDAAGAPDTRRAAVLAARSGGEVMLLGLREPGGDVDYAAVVVRELRLSGSFAYTPGDFRLAVELLAAGTVSVDRWTRALALEEGGRALEQAAGPPGTVLKFALRP